MNRREFLFFAKYSKDAAEISCEQLYMRYVDSTVDGTTPYFFRNLEERLAAIRSLRLIEPSWLSCDELERVQCMLEAFRERGGRIEYQRSTRSAPESTSCGS